MESTTTQRSPQRLTVHWEVQDDHCGREFLQLVGLAKCQLADRLIFPPAIETTAVCQRFRRAIDHLRLNTGLTMGVYYEATAATKALVQFVFSHLPRGCSAVSLPRTFDPLDYTELLLLHAVLIEISWIHWPEMAHTAYERAFELVELGQRSELIELVNRAYAAFLVRHPRRYRRSWRRHRIIRWIRIHLRPFWERRRIPPT